MKNYNFTIKLNAENLLHNVRYLESWKNKKLIPVVKANAYGHGMELIVDTLYKNGYRNFAVAKLSEAEKLVASNKYKDIEILVFESIVTLEDIKNIPNIQISINSMKEFERSIEIGIPTERMHIKIDFGFGRSGLHLDDIDKFAELAHSNNFKFKGIYSHFFAANYNSGIDIINSFREIVKEIGRERFELIHLQNSASVFNYDIDIVTHIRVGMLTYGFQEPGFYDSNLKRVFCLEGAVSDIRDISQNDYIAYEKKDSQNLAHDKHLARLKIGYGDGFLKINEGSTCLINNKEFTINQVTMDNTFVAVDESIKVGDKVELYFNLDKTTSHLNMGMQEIFIQLNDRIKREFV